MPKGSDLKESPDLHRNEQNGVQLGTESVAALHARIARLERENEAFARDRGEPRPLVQALIESETRYRTILESEPACVKLVARDGSLLSMNPAGLAMVEAATERQVLGVCVFDLVRPHDRHRFIAMHDQVFEGETARLEFEIEGFKGTRRVMETFAAPLEDESGEIIAHLAVTHDITLRKKEHSELTAYRERLEALVEERTRELEASREEARRIESLASLGTLAAGLAHELNNPLGTILLGADMLRLDLNDGARDETIDAIRKDVARCSHIVKSMLRFGRDEASEKFPVSMNQVARVARDNSRELIDRYGIRLELDLTNELPLIEGNSTELGQVVLNLIQNAVLASEPGALVVVRTWESAGRLECTVEDSGCGMSEHIQEHARDPFFTTRLSNGGTGLGLSVSHGIVTNHRGTLVIDSQEGSGTIVRVSIPFDTSQAS